MSLHISHPSGYRARYYKTFGGPGTKNRWVWYAEYYRPDGQEAFAFEELMPLSKRAKEEGRPKAEKLVRKELERLASIKTMKCDLCGHVSEHGHGLMGIGGGKYLCGDKMQCLQRQFAHSDERQRTGGKRRHAKSSAARLPHKMTPETVKYQSEVKERARRSRQIICTELPDGTAWGCDQYGQCMYAKNVDVCAAKLVTKANRWHETHPKAALQAQVDELNRMLKE